MLKLFLYPVVEFFLIFWLNLIGRLQDTLQKIKRRSLKWVERYHIYGNLEELLVDEIPISVEVVHDIVFLANELESCISEALETSVKGSIVI
jgi:hypothetical protein